MSPWLTIACICLSSIGATDQSERPEYEKVTLRGQVVTLPEAIESFELPKSQGPIAPQVVLKQDDGTILPLLYVEGSRAFFDDDRLRNRSAELVVRRFEGLPYIQVVSSKIADEAGDLRIPEYYCDVCSITTRYDQSCPCCQGSMVLRFRPEL